MFVISSYMYDNIQASANDLDSDAAHRSTVIEYFCIIEDTEAENLYTL